MRNSILDKNNALATSMTGRQYYRYLGADDLETEAGNLSSFDGNIGSFVEPLAQGKMYTIILTNANANPRTALLAPGLLRNQVGLIGSGAFNDITGAAGLSGATTSPQPIEFFNAFIDKFPTVIAGFKVSTSNIQQFEADIVIQKESPFCIEASTNISVSAWASEANPNTTLISVQRAFYMDNQTSIRYMVLGGGTQVSLQLFCGVSLSLSRVLRDGVAKSKIGAALAGGSATSYLGR